MCMRRRCIDAWLRWDAAPHNHRPDRLRAGRSLLHARIVDDCCSPIRLILLQQQHRAPSGDYDGETCSDKPCHSAGSRWNFPDRHDLPIRRDLSYHTIDIDRWREDRRRLDRAENLQILLALVTRREVCFDTLSRVGGERAMQQVRKHFLDVAFHALIHLSKTPLPSGSHCDSELAPRLPCCPLSPRSPCMTIPA